MSKSKNRFKSQDARLALIEDTVIKPPAPDIPADAVAFARSIGFEPDPWQVDVLNSDSKRICINAARQTGKSVTVALKALHYCLTHADALVLILSVSERQSKLLFTALLKHYNAANRPIYRAETTLSLELENNSKIIALPSSEQTIRGYSAVNLLLCDESARIPDELYYSSLPFIAVSDGAIIQLSTPFGERGFFYETFTGSSPEWLRIKVTAAECNRISDKFLKEQRESMGEYWYLSEFNCEFLAPETGLFSPDSIRAIFDNDLMEYDI
jgi:hypothetical protein